MIASLNPSHGRADGLDSPVEGEAIGNQAGLVAAPRRILILRPDNLGDLVLFSGALQHIRNHWPSAHITLCVRSFGRELFAHCPHLDELIPYESLRWMAKCRWPRFLSESKFLRAILQQMCSAALPAANFDLALMPVMAPLANYHRAMALMTARSRVGVFGRLENQSDREERQYRTLYSAQMDASKWPMDFPEMEANRLFLQFIGINVNGEDIWPEFWTKPADVEEAAKLFAGLGAQLVIGIAPGAVSPLGKRLPPEWYLQVLQMAGSQNLSFVLLGGKNEIDICRDLELCMRQLDGKNSVVNLAGKTSVLQLIECMRRCDLLLCPDAAPMHIAAALRKPVLGVMGGGHGARFHPWGDPNLARVVRKTMDCYGCNWNCKYETFRCIQEITPADAARELRSLLKAMH